MQYDKFVHPNTGKILMSLLLGIGLATFFRSVCKGRNCIIEQSPSLGELDGQTYLFDDKCYKMNKNAISCDKNKKTVNFA